MPICSSVRGSDTDEPPSRERALVGAADVVGDQHDLLEAVARLGLLGALRVLHEQDRARVVLTADEHLVHLAEVVLALFLQAERTGVELGRAVEVVHVDAEAGDVDAVAHRRRTLPAA